jgi:hypothetical protein
LDWVPDAVDFRIEPVGIDGADDHDYRDSGLIGLNAPWEGDLLTAGRIEVPASIRPYPMLGGDI